MPQSKPAKRPKRTKPPLDAQARRRRREVGERVRSLRRERKIAQDALANRIGIERSTLQRIEYGKTRTTLDTLWAIADALGVPVTRLLADDWSTSPGGGAEGG